MKKIKNVDDFKTASQEKFAVIFFDAEFTNQKDVVKKALKSVEEYKSKYDLLLTTCDAEEHHQFASEMSVLSLPCVVLSNKGKPIRKSTDFDPVNLKKWLDIEINAQMKLDPESADPKKTFEKYLESLIRTAPVMIFMKGDPHQPRCGFSKQLVEILSRNDIEYKSFNILEDEEVRQGLKEYSNWPTYPQIYVDGEFIGGLDILKQLEESGELAETLKSKVDNE